VGDPADHHRYRRHLVLLAAWQERVGWVPTRTGAGHRALIRIRFDAPDCPPI
jgi:hypothetical protein